MTNKGDGPKPVPFETYCLMPELPDAAVFGWGHRLAFFAAEGGAEAGLIDDRSVGAEVIGGVGVGLDLRADYLGAGVFAPVLAEGDVEALRAGEAVDLLVDVDAVLLRAREVGHVGEDQAAVVGGVLAERQLAVDVDIVDGDEAAVLVDEAAGAGLEVL